MHTSTLSDLFRQSVASLRILVAFTVILGIAYPVGIWVVGLAFDEQATGQPVRMDGRVVGSKLLGQEFTGAQWFHSRPSANKYDSLASAPSNLGPLNPDLLAAIEERRTAVAKLEGSSADEVPADALTASGSGLDPHISSEYALLQADRVASENGLPVKEVEALIAKHTEGRSLGFLGEPGVNVLTLNVAIAKASQDRAG